MFHIFHGIEYSLHAASTAEPFNFGLHGILGHRWYVAESESTKSKDNVSEHN